MKRLLLSFFSLCLATLLLLIADRTVLRAAAGRLQLPRYERQVTTTPEFHYIADINTAGYRNNEFAPRRAGTIRIVTIGDSFTYGWGVEEADSWPRILETILRETGRDVEILNLGKPGDTPLSYARTALRMIPQLKPDAVLVAILQGDDLAQLANRTLDQIQTASTAPLMEVQPAPAPDRNSRALVAQWGKRLFPNLLRLRDLRSRIQSTPISAIWAKQVRSIRDEATAEERARYDRLPADIQAIYQQGHLNPSLLRLAISRPDYFSGTWELDTSATQLAIEKLFHCVAAVRATADRNGAIPVFVSIPYGMYCSKDDWGNWQRIGFELHQDMLVENHADEAIRRAVRRAGLELYGVLDDFRPIAQQTPLYFPLDGHFNPQGHRAFARLVAERISPTLEDLPRQAQLRPSAE